MNLIIFILIVVSYFNDKLPLDKTLLYLTILTIGDNLVYLKYLKPEEDKEPEPEKYDPWSRK